MKKLWKILDSNARASIKANGKIPQRIYPYCGVNFVSPDKKEKQANLNAWAKFALENRGGVWENSPDQGFNDVDNT